MVEDPIRMGRKQPWRLLLVLLLGQLASLLAAATSFSSSYIANLGVNTPLTQCLLTYLSLTVFYGSILLHRRQKLVVPWYWYIILAIIDVEGNYLSIYFTRGKNPLLGNTLVVAGTLCCALSIVGEEFCVKKKERVEVVAMLGVFGVLVCTCQISIFERKDLASVKWSPIMIALFAGYAASSFLYYTLAPFILEMSGATLFNLSLMTCNTWAVLIRTFFYREQVDWLYYVALAIVAVGLVIFSLNDTTSSPATTIADDEAAIQYEPLLEQMPN